MSDLGRIIWEASHADEGTISATGADIVADAILAAGYRNQSEPIDLECLVVENGWVCAQVNACTCAGGTPEGNYAHETHCGLEPIADISGALAKAGYRKPRTVSSAAELDALPVGSVVLRKSGSLRQAWQKDYDGWWVVGSSHVANAAQMLRNGSVVVLSEGER